MAFNETNPVVTAQVGVKSTTISSAPINAYCTFTDASTRKISLKILSNAGESEIGSTELHGFPDALIEITKLS